MRKFALWLTIVGAPLAVAACTGSSTGTYRGQVMSCFSSSAHGGMKCVATPDGPETDATDVDDDGKPDTFECADRDSDDDGVPDFEDHDDADHVDDDHAEHDGGTATDKDDDGIDDDIDC